MEKLKPTLFFIISYIFAAATAADVGVSENICGGKEIIVKLDVYVQDILSGPNATVYTVAEAPDVTAASPTSFGQIHVVDDLFTAEPDINSAALGRAQGITTSADMRIRAIAMNLNFVFTAGEFNGSTICIVGRNQIGDPARELPVVGGTGAFRFARGYAITRSLSNGVLQYTFYVTYYGVEARANT